MKLPRRPPDFHKLLNQAVESGRLEAIHLELAKGTDPGYVHWDKLGYLSPPADLSHEEWWLALKWQRTAQYQGVPLSDVDGRRFVFALAEPIPQTLHSIDFELGGSIGMPSGTPLQVTDQATKNQYLVRSLVQEAIASSKLEGAATTRRAAKELIRTGRRPQDLSERMILNNYRTMQQIGKLKDKPLSKELVLGLHRFVTTDTLDDKTAAGRFRRTDEQIDVGDDLGNIFHTPPLADQLDERMEAMCAFANGQSEGPFVHPVIRSIILHFWLAYDHPFVDGNGRTARALFYWSMLHHKYWLGEYISISEIILQRPAKYGMAFLHTETDDNDLTYFVHFHLDVLRRAIRQLQAYIDRRREKDEAARRKLRGVTGLNHRQRALIGHALRNPHHRYTIESHQSSHGVVNQTARTDLHNLADRGMLEREKTGRTFYFTPIPNLEAKLAQLGDR